MKGEKNTNLTLASLVVIQGTAGVRVCHVRDDVPSLPAQPTGDLAKSLLSDPRFTIEFPPNSYNEALLRSYAERIHPKKRRERFLPPIRGWNPSGSVRSNLFFFLAIIIFRIYFQVGKYHEKFIWDFSSFQS